MRKSACAACEISPRENSTREAFQGHLFVTTAASWIRLPPAVGRFSAVFMHFSS